LTHIEPEIWVEDAAAAVAFYERALGAEVIHQVGSGGDIVARLRVGEGRFWVAPADPESGRHDAAALAGATGRLLLVVDDPAETLARALQSGARELAPVREEHGWTVGRMTDPFGHEWEIARAPE